MKRKFFLFLLSGLMILPQTIPAAAAINIIKKPKTEQNISVTSAENITRAQAAKTISILVTNSKREIQNLERVINYSDTDTEKWYDCYINAAEYYGYMKASGKFNPDEPLKSAEALEIFKKLNISLKPAGTYVTKNEWQKALDEYIEKTDDAKKPKLEKLVVLNQSGGKVHTDLGFYEADGIDLKDFLDKEIKAYTKNDEILLVSETVTASPVLHSAYITANDGQNIEVLIGQERKRYAYKNDHKDIVNTICDVTLENGNVKELLSYKEKITSTILSVDNEKIELEGIGRIKMSEFSKVYSVVTGEAEQKGIAALTVGTDIAYYVLGNDEIKAAVITKKPEYTKVNVLITSNENILHSNVNLKSDSGFTLYYGSAARDFAAGEALNISANENADLFGQQRITAVPKNGGKIRISTVSKAYNDNPEYRGSISVSKSGGKFTIVNELGLEEYLYAVVPSEMSPANGLEAAKIQAIIARTYAISQFSQNRYHSYGANVIDTVSSQVYNNIPESKMSIQAVDETEGMVITAGGTPIEALFFSTSSGYTANKGEVWFDGGLQQFPSKSDSYVVSKSQTSYDPGDLKVEANADSFFRKTDIDSYDKNFPMFRWNVEMSQSQLKRAIDRKISALYNDGRSHLIKTLQADGSYRSTPINTVGYIKDIIAVERGDGGIITKLKITGTEKTVMLSTEYVIRMVLTPQTFDGDNITIKTATGENKVNFQGMPSAFFTMDKTYAEDGSLNAIKFYGGGYGHSVGLSQNGAKGMLDRGFSIEEIISHYYPGTKLDRISGE